MKRLFSILLAVMFIMTLTPTTFAASTTPKGSITIKGAQEGAVYTVYKMFDLESFDEDGKSYAYTIADGWGNFVDTAKFEYTEGVTLNYFTRYGSDNKYVKMTTYNDETISLNESQAIALAQAAAEYAKEKNIAAVCQLTEANGFENATLDLGYYVITSSIGVLCALTTTDYHSEINAKNLIPTVEKKVQEDSTKEFGDENTAEIGDTVNFKTTVTVPIGSRNYSVHDAMGEGLTLDPGSIKVFYEEFELNSITITPPASYTDDSWIDKEVEKLDDQFIPSDTTTDLEDRDIAYAKLFDYERADAAAQEMRCDFELIFTPEFMDYLNEEMIKTQSAGTPVDSVTLVIEYSAVLNEHAKTGTEPNLNSAKVRYGQNLWTKASTTYTYTYTLEVIKIDNNNYSLSGAEFEMYDVDPASGTAEKPVAPMEFVVVTEGRKYRVATPEDTSTVTKLVVDHRIDIVGLDSDTETHYWLVETAAPAGYNKLESPIKVTADGKTIKEYTTIKATETEGQWKYEEGGLAVVNQAGTLLPETGGIGTTIFYAAGGIMVVGAFVLLITKKRMGNRA